MLAIKDKVKTGVQGEKRQENQQTRPKYDVFMYLEMNSWVQTNLRRGFF